MATKKGITEKVTVKGSPVGVANKVNLERIFRNVQETSDVKVEVIRDILEKGSVNYLRLDEELKRRFYDLTKDIQIKLEQLEIAEAQIASDGGAILSPDYIKSIKKEIEDLISKGFIKGKLPANKALAIGAGKVPELTEEEQKALKSQGITKIGPKASRSELRTPEIAIPKTVGVSKIANLIKIANGLEPGTWDDLAIIRNMLGLDPKKWERGHVSTSIISLRIEAVLRESRTLTEAQRSAISKLLFISRKIDLEDNKFFEDIQKTLKIKNPRRFGFDIGYKIIGALLSNARKTFSKKVALSKEIKNIDGKASIDILIQFEDVGINQLKGNLQQLIGAALSNIIEGAPPTKGSKLDLSKLGIIDGTLPEVEGSPSLISLVEKAIFSTILGKTIGEKLNFVHKFTDKKFGLRSKKVYNLSKVTIPSKTKVLSKFKNLLRPRAVDYNESLVDILNVKNIINETLAIDVEKEMGRPTDPAIKLRYQTGRFADSAKLLTLTRSQAKTLYGTYTYMRSPYDVFLPGHKLGTPQRDPRLYVEGAIRKSALKILQKKFPGLVLELR